MPNLGMHTAPSREMKGLCGVFMMDFLAGVWDSLAYPCVSRMTRWDPDGS